MNDALRLTLLAALLVACNGGSKERREPGSEQRAAPTPSATASADSDAAVHAGHDCETEHGGAHPPLPPPQVATATALAPEARPKLTTLRVMAHVGAVIIRKESGAWMISGPNGCRVSPLRIERALDNLASLRSEPTNTRPQDGREFELQVVAQIGEERALHFDMAGRVAGRDLVQLANYSTYWISGFDRELWKPDARVWCAGP